MKDFLRAHLPSSEFPQLSSKVLTESLQIILEFGKGNVISFINKTPLKQYVEGKIMECITTKNKFT